MQQELQPNVSWFPFNDEFKHQQKKSVTFSSNQNNVSENQQISAINNKSSNKTPSSVSSSRYQNLPPVKVEAAQIL